MYKDNTLRSFVFFSGSGCLLPALAIFNLLFGWIFLKPKLWLITEGALILFFIINGFMTTRKIISSPSKKRNDVIDVKGEVVQERHHILGTVLKPKQNCPLKRDTSRLS